MKHQSRLKKIIFITGASRSGTTLMNRVLNQHPQITGMNELHFLGDLVYVQKFDIKMDLDEQIELTAKLLCRQKYGLWHNHKTDSQDAIAKKILRTNQYQARTASEVFWLFCEHVAQQDNKNIVSEQTPRNIFYADKLLTAFAHSHVIYMLRDPRAVMASQKSKWRRRNLGARNIPIIETIRNYINYHPITMAQLWRKAADQAHSMRMDPRFHCIKFEDLIKNPQTVLTDLCQAMDVCYDAGMMQIKHEGSSHQANLQGHDGFNQAAINTWKQRLTASEIYICQRLCADQMKNSAYPFLKQTKLPVWNLCLDLIRYPIHLMAVVLLNPRRGMIQLQAIIGHGFSDKESK